MSYLQDFQHDIFISYAHVDNATTGRRRGWVARFEESLDDALAHKFGRRGEIVIWRDRTLGGNEEFNLSIYERERRSALFLALTSAGYFHPDSYCLKELRWFFENAGKDRYGLVVGERRSRIFNVRLDAIDPAKWPEPFQGKSGHQFFEVDREDETCSPLDPDKKSFEKALRILVRDIEVTLRAMKQAVPAPAQPKPSFAVFLADTSDALASLRSKTARDLRDKGLQVITDIPPPFEAAPHTDAVVAALRNSQLSVHLLDDIAGRAIPGDTESYSRKQAELSLLHAKAPFVWIPRKLDIELIEDPDHKQFLKEIETNPKDSAHSFVRGLQSDLVSTILEKIEEIQNELNRAASPRAALLDFHPKDQLHARELGRFLEQHEIQPFINPEEDDPRTNLGLLEERLKQVAAFIVFYGSVTEKWVLSRLSTALQIAIEKNYPLKAFGICAAPPHTKADITFKQAFVRVHVMDYQDAFNPATWQPLLDS